MRLIVLLLCLIASATLTPGVARAATPPHYFVDGKLGDDGNAGTSLGAAFKTLERALDQTPSAGTRISIVGYDDYTYRETLSRPYQLVGTSAAPIVIEGYRPATGPFTRPTISGARVINDAGSTRWDRPNSASYPDVWRTAWSEPIRGYDADHRAYRMERIFVDNEHQLTRPSAAPSLEELQRFAGSQFWDGTHLYVHLGRWDGQAIDPNPNHHRISVPAYYGIVANYLSAWVTIRDLNIEQAAPGIAFHRNSHDMTVRNVDVSFNYPAGIVTQATRATFTNVTGYRNTMQLAKVDDGGRANTFSHVESRQNPAQGIKVTGGSTTGTTIADSVFSEGSAVPAWAATYSGEVQGIDIEHGARGTRVLRNRITDMGRGLMLYQYSAAGKALDGTLVRGNYFAGNLHAVVLWDGRAGGDGTGDASFRRNVYFRNGNAIFALAGTRGKTFRRESIYGSYAAQGTGRSAVLVQGSGTRLVIKDSILAKSPVYAIRSTGGAVTVVKYSDVWGYSKSAGYGTVRWKAGIRHRNPAFVSIVPGSSGFLVLPAGSPLRSASSTGGRIGAK